MTQIIDYSNKAIAVIGDTKSIKNALKELGGRFNPRLSCGAGWIFPKTKIEDVKKLLNCGEVVNNDIEKVASNGDKYKDALNEYLKLDTSSYHREGNIGAFKFEDGKFLLFAKPHIETSFCFHDEGEDYEFYKKLKSANEKMAAYFKAENLKLYNDWIKKLEKGDDIFVKCYYKSLPFKVDLHTKICSWETPTNDERKITDNERQQLIDAFKWCKSLLEKRLNTYLKKYGVSKLHTWTYWADR